jgi:hypothetical protein
MNSTGNCRIVVKLILAQGLFSNLCIRNCCSHAFGPIALIRAIFYLT